MAPQPRRSAAARAQQAPPTTSASATSATTTPAMTTRRRPRHAAPNQFAALVAPQRAAKRTASTQSQKTARTRARLECEPPESSSPASSSRSAPSLASTTTSSASNTTPTTTTPTQNVDANQTTQQPSTFVARCRLPNNAVLRDDDGLWVFALNKNRAYALRGIFLTTPIAGGSLVVAGATLNPNPHWQNYIRSFNDNNDNEEQENHSNDDAVVHDHVELRRFLALHADDDSLATHPLLTGNKSVPELATEPTFTPCFMSMLRCPPRIEPITTDTTSYHPSTFVPSALTARIARLLAANRSRSSMFDAVTDPDVALGDVVFVACLFPKLAVGDHAPYVGYQSDRTLRLSIEETDPTGNRQSIGEIVRYPSSWTIAQQALVNISMNCDPRTVIATLGGTNMGKSTFCTVLANTLLSRFRRVALIDCDLGQSELTPTGKISLCVLERPIIGPSYTQMRIPERSHHLGVAGTTNSSYIPAVLDLKRHYDTLVATALLDGNRNNNDDDGRNSNFIPLIVNTCGWVTEFGEQLHMELLTSLQVTHLVHFDGNNTRNVRFNDYTVNGVATQSLPQNDPRTSSATWRTKEPYKNPEMNRFLAHFNHAGLLTSSNSVFKVEAGEQTGCGTKTGAKTNRDLSVELYFFQKMQPDIPWSLLEESERIYMKNALAKIQQKKPNVTLEDLVSIRMKAYRSFYGAPYSHPKLFVPFDYKNSVAAVIPRAVPFEWSRLLVLSPDQSQEIGDLFRAINATIVVLAIDDTQYETPLGNPIFDEQGRKRPLLLENENGAPPLKGTVVGHGLLRTIDVKNGIYYVTIPEDMPQSIVSRINLMIRDVKIFTPQQLLSIGLTKSLLPSMPYMVKEKAEGFGSAVWRARHNLIRTWQKKS